MQDCALNFRFQELDLSREAFIFSESSKEAEWQEAVRQYLHPKGRYRKVSVSCRWTRLLTPPCKGSSIGWNKRGGSSWGVHWPQSGHAGRVFGWVETKGGGFLVRGSLTTIRPCREGFWLGWNKRGGSWWGVHWPQSGCAGRVFWCTTNGESLSSALSSFMWK